jgi:hypothetical protein
MQIRVNWIFKNKNKAESPKMSTDTSNDNIHIISNYNRHFMDLLAKDY